MFTQTRTLWTIASVVVILVLAREGLLFPHQEGSFAQTTLPPIVPVTMRTVNHLPGRNMPPQPLNIAEIKEALGYPTPARNAGIEGRVLMRIWVDAQGKYVKHHILESAHPLLDIPCELFVPFLEFRPGYEDGLPVLSSLDIPFHFELP
ncbi:MAG: hypothetical protein OHK0039_48340 [Bacteroidia bacterium]